MNLMFVQVYYHRWKARLILNQADRMSGVQLFLKLSPTGTLMTAQCMLFSKYCRSACLTICTIFLCVHSIDLQRFLCWTLAYFSPFGWSWWRYSKMREQEIRNWKKQKHVKKIFFVFMRGKKRSWTLVLAHAWCLFFSLNES